tara:strand:+ start:193 stop:690 length:498 start_codon:yes stop_codon:yes gene_type:complete
MVQKNFEMRIGSRAQVFHGTAKQTSGGLQKCDLKKNKRGAIVSRRASARAKKENRLVKAGFVTQKGKFGVVQRGGEDSIEQDGDTYDYIGKSNTGNIIVYKNKDYTKVLFTVPDDFEANIKIIKYFFDEDKIMDVLTILKTSDRSLVDKYTRNNIIKIPKKFNIF